MSDPYQSRVQADTVIRNIGQLVTVAQQPIAGTVGPLQVIDVAAMAVHNGIITWIGPDNEQAPYFIHEDADAAHSDSITLVDAQGAVVTPGLVDSHTHLLFAGDRAEEFHLRRAGASYAQLLAEGRGILSTVQATNSANDEMLLALAEARLEVMRHYGTTTVEVKTGYGLSKVSEQRSLHLINQLAARQINSLHFHKHLRIMPTFLGAHSVPPESAARREYYVDLVVEEMLPAFAGQAQFCDVFCEREAFTLAESRRILTRAKSLGYLLKVHADQLSPSGGARLAAELGATSADHLDFATEADLDAMRAAGVVATLLPGCSYTLRTPYPSARRLLDRGLHVALATDFNPGTSYCENMQMMVGLAMSAMGMSLEEALTAATINGARALALHEQIGSIEVGKHCELAFWSIADYREIGYHFGGNLVRSIFVQ